jgi:DNA-binding transcriptional MerR regulator
MPKAARVSGQRSYTSDMVSLVAILRLAKACGFSLPEMRRLVTAMRPNASLSDLWKEAASNHRGILETQIAQLHAMSRLLEQVEHCRCTDLTECGRIATRIVPHAGSPLSPDIARS